MIADLVPTLTPSAQRILVYAEENPGPVTTAGVADHLGLSIRTVKRAQAVLRARGLARCHVRWTRAGKRALWHIGPELLHVDLGKGTNDLGKVTSEPVGTSSSGDDVPLPRSSLESTTPTLTSGNRALPFRRGGSAAKNLSVTSPRTTRSRSVSTSDTSKSSFARTREAATDDLVPLDATELAAVRETELDPASILADYEAALRGRGFRVQDRFRIQLAGIIGGALVEHDADRVRQAVAHTVLNAAAPYHGVTLRTWVGNYLREGRRNAVALPSTSPLERSGPPIRSRTAPEQSTAALRPAGPAWAMVVRERALAGPVPVAA